MQHPKIFNFSPGRVLLFSFIFIIFIGTLLLLLPQSREVDISFLDILFTATSVTCVTGLHVVPISYFSYFGKCIILCLIQVGGLGLMTLSFFFISQFLRLGMATQLMAGEILEIKTWSKIKHILGLIIGTTFFVELIGTILLYFPFRQLLEPQKAIFFAIFHSVSAFCNAGVSLFEDGIISFQNQIFPLFIIAILVLIGSTGFLVWFELTKKLKSIFKSSKRNFKIINISLHTKIVITTSIILIILGTTMTWLLEYNNMLKNLDTSHSLFASFFHSISIRSAGFKLFNLEQASLATLLLFLFLMYIGASPGSTGSGIKTTTFALFVATMATFIKNREDVEIFGRTISRDQIYKAITIVALSFSWIMLLTFILLITEPDFSFIQILFEATGAFSTSGLSTGITSSLSSIGKTLLIPTMIVGRIGSLTLVFALRKKKKQLPYHYPEERIAIG